MVQSVGAAACIARAKAKMPGETNIMVSSQDFDELVAAGAVKTETYQEPHVAGGVTTISYLEGLVVAVMGEPLSAAAFEQRADKINRTRLLEADEAARRFAQGNAPVNAISAVDAILFAIQIDDHFDRLQWLTNWRDGEWGEMRRNYPEFAANDWRRKT